MILFMLTVFLVSQVVIVSLLMRHPWHATLSGHSFMAISTGMLLISAHFAWVEIAGHYSWEDLVKIAILLLLSYGSWIRAWILISLARGKKPSDFTKPRTPRKDVSNAEEDTATEAG